MLDWTTYSPKHIDPILALVSDATGFVFLVVSHGRSSRWCFLVATKKRKEQGI